MTTRSDGGIESDDFSQREGWIAVIAQGVILAAAATAALLCGGYQQGSMGIFFGALGVAMVFLPPRRGISWVWWGLAALLLGSASLALLPQEWFHQPVWRAVLQASPEIPLGNSVSTVPRETIFWLQILGGSVLAGLFSLSQPTGTGGMRGFAVAGALFCAGYAILSVYAEKTGWKAPFDGAETFGFFPNRNHTATLLITGCLLALGSLTTEIHRKNWSLAVLAGASLAVCAWTLMLHSLSRGGVVFLLLGVMIWIAGLGRQNLSRRLMISFAAIAAAAVVFLLGSGSKVSDRLLALAGWRPNLAAEHASGPGPNSNAPPDVRVLIYRDTLRMIKDFPLTGTGLGTYGYVYPRYAEDSLWKAGALHPESDWLMLLAEGGPVAFLAAAAALGFAFLQLRGAKNSDYWPLRWAILCASLAAILHGIVDVPLHRVQLGWWVLGLAGLGLGEIQAPGSIYSRRVQHIIFVAGGVALVMLGWRLVQAEWMNKAPLPPYAAKYAGKRIAELFEAEQFDAALEYAPQAIRESPMNRELYRQRGILELHFEGSDATVDSLFAAERLLDPGSPRVAEHQGTIWLPVDPLRTANLWLKAVKRQGRLEKAAGLLPGDGLVFYEELLGRAKGNNVLGTALEPALDSPRLYLAWLKAAPSVAKSMTKTSENEGFLSELDPTQRRNFLGLWFRRGDRSSLWNFLDENPAWDAEAWDVRLQAKVEAGNYHEAIESICQRYDISLELPPLGAGGTGGSLTDDPAEAFMMLWKRGNDVSARRILNEGIAKHPSNSELRRLRAALAWQQGDPATTWKELNAFLHATGRPFYP